jgi:hypothetical protein
MTDIPRMSGSSQSLKRPLEDEQEEMIRPAQPIPSNSSYALEDGKVAESASLTAVGDHRDSRGDLEQDSKRVKIDNNKLDIQSDNIDAREKVKGIALVKEE